MKSRINDKDSWYLRIILETYALALDVPLRVYDMAQAEKYYVRACEEEPDFATYFPNSEEFDRHIIEIATHSVEDGLKKINEKFAKKFTTGTKKNELWKKVNEKYGDYWYTYRINSYPLLRALDEHWCWKWWLFCWNYYYFVLSPLPEEMTTQGFGFKDDHGRYYLHLSYKYVPDLQRVLVAGPVWQPPNRYTPEGIDEQVSQMVDKFLQSMPSPPKPEDCVKNCTAHYERQRLIRMGNSRFPISANSLENHLKQVVNALQCLLAISLLKPELPRSDYTNLAAWSLFAIRTTNMIQGEFHHLCAQKNPQFNTVTVYYRLDHALVRDTETPSSWIKTVLHVTKNQLPQLAWLDNLPTNIEPLSSLITPAVTSEQETTLCITKQLNNSFERFLSEVFTKQSANKLERLFLLRDWANDWFGIFSENSEKAKNSLVEVAGQLALYVSRFMSADITTLYRYDCSAETLNLLNLYHHVGETRKQWGDKEPAHMTKAGKDSEKRLQSICYRAVDNRETQFCGFFDPTGKRPPLREGETLLPPPQGLDSHQSGIAAPLLVYGRVWGIVEVLGDRFYQFCVSDKRLLNEVTSVLSTFFYYQWFLNKLYSLNQIVVHDDGKSEKTELDSNSDKKYNNVCQCLAELFLSHGVALWVFDSQVEGYRCRGVYNRSDSQLSSEIIKLTDGESVIGFTLKQKQQYPKLVWWQGTVGEPPLGNAWLNKPRNQSMLKAGIKTLCSIPVRLQENNEELAFIILYNKTTEKYDQRWESLVSFVAHEVALLLQALQAQARWEDESRSFIVHELKGGVTMIADRAQSIEEWYKQHAWRWARNLSIAEEADRLNILVKDTRIHAAGLQETIKLLGQGNFKTYFRPTSNPVIEKARKLFHQPVSPLSLRDQFNHIFRSEWSEQKQKSLDIDYQASCNPRVRIHQNNLHHILRNLRENAGKYSLPGSVIDAKVNCSKYGVELQVGNLGIPLAEGEKSRIFQDGYRGIRNAVGVKGEGKGLFLARNICDLYHIQINYDSEPISNQEDYCKHLFTLLFPLTIVEP